jgi:serine carboxypeptidase-like clade 2
LDNAGAAFFWWSHGLVSDSNYLGIFKACNMSNVGPLRRLSSGKTPFMPALQMSMAALAAAEASGRTFGKSCSHYENAAMASFNDVDIYDVYADVCVDAAGNKQLKPQAAAMVRAAGLPVPRQDALTAQVGAETSDDATGGTAANAAGSR